MTLPIPATPRSSNSAPHNQRGFGRPADPSVTHLEPLGISDVGITGGRWYDAQRRNRDATVPHILHWLEREGWLANFDAAAAGTVAADRRGREFSDSEVYKLLEAMAWELGRDPHPDLEAQFATIAARVIAAQDEDGYLNTQFGHPGQQPRWSDLEWGHELYCAGFLIQAAVARARTGFPDDPIVACGCRVADRICEDFGPGKIESVDGHAEVESALVELYRVTGQARYLDQAEMFLLRRGHHVLRDIEFGREYFQDDIPILAATVLRGHAVRALYHAAGAVDAAIELHDQTLLHVVAKQWKRTIARRTYITGGMGSRHHDEAFGDDYSLPADEAYSETCAGVASVLLAWRLLLATGESAYADLIERTLYNVVATSPSADGRSFFYANTLHRRELTTQPPADVASPRAGTSMRAPWFEVSCCPTNVARTFASLAAYVATTDSTGLQIHQYATATINATTPAGGALIVSMETRYPEDGDILIRIDSCDNSQWSLSLRVPAWAEHGATLTSRGQTRDVAPGTVVESHQWARGDEVRLHLPVEPRFTHPSGEIDATRGCIAIEQGPVVLAVESVDLPPDSDIACLRIDASSEPVRINGNTTVKGRFIATPPTPWPYSVDPAAPTSDTPSMIPLIPYADWANRGPSRMRVWIPRLTQLAHAEQACKLPARGDSGAQSSAGRSSESTTLPVPR